MYVAGATLTPVLQLQDAGATQSMDRCREPGLQQCHILRIVCGLTRLMRSAGGLSPAGEGVGGYPVGQRDIVEQFRPVTPRAPALWSLIMKINNLFGYTRCPATIPSPSRPRERVRVRVSQAAGIPRCWSGTGIARGSCSAPDRHSAWGDTFQHRPYVAFPVLFLKQDVPRLHRGLVHIPEQPHRVRWRVRNDV